MAILTAFLEWKNICIGTHTTMQVKCVPSWKSRVVGSRERGGTLLLLAAIKAKRELVKRMDENSARINTEITQEMKNCTLFDKDRQLLTLFVHKTKESLKTTLRQNVMERERKKTPQSTLKDSPRPQDLKNSRNGEKGRKRRNIIPSS